MKPPPIPSAAWEELLTRRKPKKARKWVARWLERHAVEAVYTEPPELHTELVRDVLALKEKR